MKKTTSFLSAMALFVIIIFACTNKEINLITNVELEFTQSTTSSAGVVNDLIPATFTITPEVIRPEFIYYFQYEILEGEGVFLNSNQELIPAGELNLLVLEEGASNFILDLNYQPITPGNHRVQVTASDNFEKSFSAILNYTIKNLDILWDATSNVTTVEPGKIVPITITLQNNSDDPEVTFQRRYSFEEGQGTLEEVDETPVLLNNFIEILPGTYRINAIANQIGTTTIDFDLRDINGQELTDSITFEVTEEILSDAADIIDFSINSVAGVINENTITVTLPAETNVTALIPIILASENATVSPESNFVQDFSGPITYIITAEDGATTKEYTVTVTLEETPDTEVPVITLNGDTTIDILVSTNYTEQGAIATDNIDETFDVTDITGTVDVTTIGTYTISYNAVDQANNAAETVTRTVNVVDGTAPIITLNGANPLNLPFGETYTELGAAATDDVDGTFDVPTIGISGTVDINTVGQYTITYNVSDSNNNPATAVTRTVNIVDETAPIIMLNGANPLNLPFGETYTEPGATVADNVDGTFDLPNSGISGMVDTNTVGEYLITYNISDSNDNPAATVIRTVNVVEVLPTNVNIFTAPFEIDLSSGEPIMVSAGIFPVNTTNKTIIWSSSDENIATVDQNGNVSAIAAGVADIIATSDAKNTITDTVKVTVYVGVTGVSINNTDPQNIILTGSEVLSATITPANPRNGNLIWTSSDTNVVSLAEDAFEKVLTIINNPGTAIVTVRTEDGNFTDTITVNVIGTEVLPTSVSIPRGDFQMDLDSGEDDVLTAQVLPVDTSNNTVTWSSSDTTIATVDPQTGTVNAITLGEVDITARSNADNSLSDTVRVTVYTSVPSLNTQTGEYFNTPGSIITISYMGAPIAGCTGSDSLRLTVSGADPSMPGVNLDISNNANGSRDFRMPSNGIVTIKAEIRRPSGQGCSKATINLPDVGAIVIGPNDSELIFPSN